MSTTEVTQFRNIVENNEFTVVIIWRGDWWGPCQDELKQFTREVYPEILARNGTIVGVVGQEQAIADKASTNFNV